MTEFRPVSIPSGAFNFCKYTIAFLLWTAVIMQAKIVVVVCFVILVFSALLKVEKAPLVFFYTDTFNKIYPSKEIILDENAILFAHSMGAIISGIAIIFLYFLHPPTGWVITGVLAVLKTSGAFGFCGAIKLYGCLSNPNGQCCRVGTKVKKYRCD